MFHYSMSVDFRLQSGNNADIAYTRTLENINMLLEEFCHSPANYGLPVPLSHTSEVFMKFFIGDYNVNNSNNKRLQQGIA